jgi:hypothetical protein
MFKCSPSTRRGECCLFVVVIPSLPSFHLHHHQRCWWLLLVVVVVVVVGSFTSSRHCHHPLWFGILIVLYVALRQSPDTCLGVQ